MVDAEEGQGDTGDVDEEDGQRGQRLRPEDIQTENGAVGKVDGQQHDQNETALKKEQGDIWGKERHLEHLAMGTDPHVEVEYRGVVKGHLKRTNNRNLSSGSSFN